MQLTQFSYPSAVAYSDVETGNSMHAQAKFADADAYVDVITLVKGYFARDSDDLPGNVRSSDVARTVAEGRVRSVGVLAVPPQPHGGLERVRPQVGQQRGQVDPRVVVDLEHVLRVAAVPRDPVEPEHGLVGQVLGRLGEVSLQHVPVCLRFLGQPVTRRDVGGLAHQEQMPHLCS